MEGGEGDDVMIGGTGHGEGRWSKALDVGKGHEGADRIRLGSGGDVAEPCEGADIVRTGGGGDFVMLFRDPAEPGARGAVNRVFCGPGDDNIVWQGAIDHNDVIDDSCEDSFFPLSVRSPSKP